MGGSSSEPLPNWRWVIGQIRNTREHVAEPGEGIDRVTKTAAVLPHRSLPKRSVGATHGEAAERSFGRVDRKKHSGRIIIGASGVRVIRERTSLSQSGFAHLIGVRSMRTPTLRPFSSITKLDSAHGSIFLQVAASAP